MNEKIPILIEYKKFGIYIALKKIVDTSTDDIINLAYGFHSCPDVYLQI